MGSQGRFSQKARSQLQPFIYVLVTDGSVRFLDELPVGGVPRSVHQSRSPPLSPPVTVSNGQSTIHWVKRSVHQSLSQTVSPSVTESNGQSTSHWVKRSVHQSLSPPLSPPVIESNGQSTSHCNESTSKSTSRWVHHWQSQHPAATYHWFMCLWLTVQAGFWMDYLLVAFPCLRDSCKTVSLTWTTVSTSLRIVSASCNHTVTMV